MLMEFLEMCMRHKSEMVIFEAARAVCTLPGVGARDLSTAITMLHMFITSPKPALRFAAVRALHKLAATHASVVSKCNDDLESLISDPNRTIATLSITTLLKTGSESGVDRLMKQIGGFMADVGSDELKVTVVQAIHELALRLPAKFKTIMAFLANALREEGGFEFKKAILDGLLDIMEVIPDAQPDGLLHLCEFIEDCEFTSLATRVLHLLGDQGPAAANPGSFIRYIYNRVILENAQVRAAAVTALAKFATRVEELRPSIIPLLQRCLDDDDDEVRDRATMFLRMLGGSTAPAADAAAAVPAATPFEGEVARGMMSGRLPLPVAALSKALTLYAMRPAAGAFSFAALPHVEVAEAAGGAGGAGSGAGSSAGFGYSSEIRAAEAAAAASKIARARARLTEAPAAAAGGGGGGAGGGAGSSAAASRAGAATGTADAGAAEALYKIPEFAPFGSLFRTSKSVELTEAELEYLVAVQKHVFAGHLVFQFTIRNTVPEMLLEKASVAMACSSDAYRPVVSIAAQKVREGHPATAFVAFARAPDAGIPSASFTCELRFNSRECDAATGEVLSDATPETYPLDGLDVTPADYVAPVPVSEFRAAWEAMGGGGEVVEQFGLPFKSVGEAVAAVVDTLGLAPCDGTGAVKPGTSKHNAYLAGVFLGGVKVLARMQVTYDADAGCVLKIGIRSDDRDVSELLMSCVS